MAEAGSDGSRLLPSRRVICDTLHFLCRAPCLRSEVVGEPTVMRGPASERFVTCRHSRGAFSPFANTSYDKWC